LSAPSGSNCTQPAIEDFPHDLFNEKQRQAGAVVVHVLVSLYLFIALAVVCDKFFVPAVEKMPSFIIYYLSLPPTFALEDYDFLQSPFAATLQVN
jgi:hypothetical protein